MNWFKKEENKKDKTIDLPEYTLEEAYGILASGGFLSETQMQNLILKELVELKSKVKKLSQ